MFHCIVNIKSGYFALNTVVLICTLFHVFGSFYLEHNVDTLRGYSAFTY